MMWVNNVHNKLYIGSYEIIIWTNMPNGLFDL